MKHLLVVTAAIEVGTGLALLSVPSAVVMLLVGAPLTTPAAITVARIGATGVLALGVACWLAHSGAEFRAARALVAGMLLYNVGAAVILGDAALRSQLTGLASWPAVALHAALAAWCVIDFLRTPPPHRF